MTTGYRCPSRLRRVRRAVTLVEAVLSTVLVAVMLVAALNTVGATTLSRRHGDDRRQGQELARELMAEILQCAYAEESQLGAIRTATLRNGVKVAAPLGPETGEVTGDRSLFDDIDDYHSWSASPPQDRDGTERAELAGWQRDVSVQFVTPAAPDTPDTKDGGARVVTVAVTREGVELAQLVALRTAAPRDTQACCLKDGTCLPLSADTCTALGGQPQGAQTTCLDVVCARNAVLFVSGGSSKQVGDDTFVEPTSDEVLRIAKIESWGFEVVLISEMALPAEYDTAAGQAIAAYVSPEVNDDDLGTKLSAATIGIVSEAGDSADELGLGVEPDSKKYHAISIVDTNHPITEIFAKGWLRIVLNEEDLQSLVGGLAPGAEVPAEIWRSDTETEPGLITIEAGGGLYGGGKAAGRRVALPWGRGGFDFAELNADGLSLMHRAIEWAAGWR